MSSPNASKLCLQVARLTARGTIILSIFTETGIIGALAKHAVLLALAPLFRKVAHPANIILGHNRRVSRLTGFGNQLIRIKFSSSNLHKIPFEFP